MLTAKQIADIIRAELAGSLASTASDQVERAAEKIATLTADDGSAVAAAMLENEVTSTLMDMTVATVLATLIEEEGGGRSNISISPMSMDHMNQHYIYEVRNEGLIRHVSIKMREDSPLQDEANWREPSHRHGLVDMAPDALTIDQLKPQAEPKEHNRPVWAIKNGNGSLFRMHDQADAERQLRGEGDHTHAPRFKDDPLSVIENRWCLHVDCPTTGCNHDPKLQDKAEATSDAE